MFAFMAKIYCDCFLEVAYIANVETGVPQGSVLGSLLYFIYINDLPNCIDERLRLFADDAQYPDTKGH